MNYCPGCTLLLEKAYNAFQWTRETVKSLKPVSSGELEKIQQFYAKQKSAFEENEAKLQKQLNETRLAMNGHLVAIERLTKQRDDLQEKVTLVEEKNKELQALAQKAQMATSQIQRATSTTAPPPPPAPTNGNLFNPKKRKIRWEPKELLTEFVRYLENDDTKTVVTAVKNSLRLNTALLTRTAEATVTKSLVPIIGKWLIESKCPANLNKEEWQGIIDTSLQDENNDKLSSYQLPCAKELLEESVTFLRSHFKPAKMQTQGAMMGELGDVLAKKRQKRGSYSAPKN